MAAYLIAALLSALAAAEASRRTERRERGFWRATSLVLVFLGMNEVLDLQTLLTSAGRAHARANAWYEHRRQFQLAFVIALAVIATVAGLVLLWLTRGRHHAVRLAQVGLTFIVAFVLMRAASFHHVNEILGRGKPGFTIGSFQELAGILIVATAALLYTRPGRRTT